MPVKPKKRGGSKPLPPERKRTEGMPLKLRPHERKLVDRAADLDHDKPYNWARRMLVSVAEHRIEGVTLDAAYAAVDAAKK